MIASIPRQVFIFCGARLALRHGDAALFVTFAPVHAPRYACCVAAEHGGGSKIAAPIARDILNECQRRDPSRRNPNVEGGRREMP